ncbi:hypothetical protein ACIQF6_19675 [Kitasatospora sp. NPDC092948]|uniref:hypothetical protein n=1 Tax=Kitasatospora sp. NPDC092948 TaxID=3364088 RepID=UPI0038160A0C
MAQGQQSFENKQIQGQVITHTIVKPFKAEPMVDPDPEVAPAAAESEETDATSE